MPILVCWNELKNVPNIYRQTFANIEFSGSFSLVFFLAYNIFQNISLNQIQ